MALKQFQLAFSALCLHTDSVFSSAFPYMRENGATCPFGFSSFLIFASRLAMFPLKRSLFSECKRALWRLKGQMVNVGFQDPKIAEAPIKQGKTQQDQNLPHRRDWSTWAKHDHKNEEKQQKEKCFHFHTATPRSFRILSAVVHEAGSSSSTLEVPASSVLWPTKKLTKSQDISGISEL